MDVLKVIAYLKDLLNKPFYGKIIITFQNGRIEHFERRESISLK